MADPFPFVQPQLVETLEKLFPLDVPNGTVPIGEVFFQAGQKSVVDFLKNRIVIQNR